MAVTRLEITSRQLYADGATFGEVGAYERIDGTIHFAVDPTHAANRQIVDLDLAPRAADGQVHFWADFCLLRPGDRARGNGRLLFEVLNRGRKLVPRHFNHAAPEAVPTERIDPGDGFLMRHGWTVAWCGWQWDVVRSPALMGLEPPYAAENGRPPAGEVQVRFQLNERLPARLLCDRVHHPYPALDPDDPNARLLVRDWADGPATEIPRSRWRFARDEGGRPVPDAAHVWLEGGFEPGRLYDVIYRPAIAPVVGTGLLAVRDTVAFLHHADAAAGNPCAGEIERTYGFGMSQSGRFLRHFLHLGLNLDEAGRQVFDGVIPHVPGARRGEFNQRFGQPSVQSTPGFGHLPPFADDDLPDPATGEVVPGLLARQRRLGGLPKIVTINTSAEYWRGDCSLMHTDLAGARDVEPPAGTRNYLFASTQHGPGVVPLPHVDATGQRGLHGFNAVDYVPFLRAALVNLDRWVSEGVEPPPSRFPRLADGTAIPARAALDAYRGLPGLTLPDPERLPVMRRVDLGPDADRGIGRWPAERGAAYPTYVSAVDADGNETGGVRLPDLTVPIATHTGWNTRDPRTGGAGQIISMQGTTLPFAPTRAAGEQAGDPRPAVEERYRDRDDYLVRVRAAAEALVAQGYVLGEDVGLLVDLARERWDALVAPSPVPA